MRHESGAGTRYHAGMTDATRSAGFTPLPRPRDAQGAARRVGVEIEFAGLTEDGTADVIRDALGGHVAGRGAHRVTLEATALGRIEVELDTALTDWGGNALVDKGLDAARGLIPVEIVTEPLDRDGLIRLDALRERLRRAGAIGTARGILLGFGVHFNVALTAYDDPYTARTCLAYGLLEDWVRRAMPIDTTRRLMPFVDPWPEAFTEVLAQAAPEPDIATIRDAYARHCNGRNFGLDLLPIFADADPEGFARLFPDHAGTKGRPAFHYRLPDSRIDDADWSLAREWERWRIVEVLADAEAVLDGLARDFLDRPRAILDGRDAWARHVQARLGAADLV